MKYPRKPKVLFPVGYFYPAQNGGPAATLYWVVKALGKYDAAYPTIITTSGYTDGRVATDQWIQTDFARLCYLSVKSSKFSLRFILECVREINDIDIVVLTSIFAPNNLVIGLWSRYKKKRVIWTPRGELDNDAIIYNKRLKLFYLKFLKISMGDELRILCTSIQERKMVQQHLVAAKISVIGNFIEYQEKIKLATEGYFMFIGRIHPKKGLENLINAFHEVAPEIDLLIYGDCTGDYGKSLIKLALCGRAADRIRFMGVVRDEDKRIAYRKASLVLMPSHTENWGNVVTEALIQGTPVYASTGTPWEPLKVESIGYWEANDVKSLTRVIQSHLTLGEQGLLEMERRCRDYALKNLVLNESKVQLWINLFSKA